jgi:hypothetical protein
MTQAPLKGPKISQYHYDDNCISAEVVAEMNHIQTLRMAIN